MSQVTQLLNSITSDNPNGIAELLPLIYQELRQLARQMLVGEKPGQTLQATDLVHEAYLRLVRNQGETVWEHRRQFFAVAAESMRRLLIEQARRKKALKRGGGLDRADIDEVEIEAPSNSLDMLDLDEALQRMEQLEPRKAQLVKLRYFAGMTIDEAAEILEIAPSTADADWVYAKSWLRLELKKDTNSVV